MSGATDTAAQAVEGGEKRAYLAEFVDHWPQFLAAALGIALGSALSYYTLSLFGPPLIEEFGWSRAEYALVGSLPLLTGAFVPVAGYLTDRFGPRGSAIVGFTAMPLGYLAFANMNGELWQFFLIYAVQNVFGILTTSLVFARVVVERFDRARGISLSLLMTAPPLAGAIAAPTLGSLIDAEGWRAGFYALAVVTAVAGVAAVMLMGRSRTTKAAKPREKKPHMQVGEILAMLRNPLLLLLLGGMFLVNLPQAFASSQLKVVLMDGGVTSATATWMMSVYAIGVIVGRFISGLALDRFPAHWVALATLGLPAIGYVVLAQGVGAIVPLTVAMSIIGFAQGAEADIGAYLISRKFGLKNFSLLLSLMTTMVLAGSAIGAFAMSGIVASTGGYELFLYAVAVATLLGATLFVMTGFVRAPDNPVTDTA